MMAEVERRTVAYKTLHLQGDLRLPVLLDIYLPLSGIQGDDLSLGALIYWHGGGLTVGNRESWFPRWLQKRITDAGHVFISPDYRLIPTGSITGHDILEDVQDAFRFIAGLVLDVSAEKTSKSKSIRISIDPDRIAAAGSSAGGLCAYLAAMHANPRPKAILSMYGQGGNFLLPHYYTVKHSVFLRGREMLDPDSFVDFLYPNCLSPNSQVMTDSPNTYFPRDAPVDAIPKPGAAVGPPGFPSNQRMFVGRLYLQLGIFFDYYTGDHEPSLSASLRKKSEELQSTSTENSPTFITEALANEIPQKHRRLFPSLCTAREYASWPPVYFIHGSIDTAVPVQETVHLHDLLSKSGVQSVMTITEGMEHSFDYAPSAEDMYKEEFDKIGMWLDGFLRKIQQPS